jgi:hypothetical protein
MIALIGFVQAQVAVPPPSNDAGAQPKAAGPDSRSSVRKPEEKIGLVRGVLKRVDPIHDQLWIHAFGGRDVRIAFDPRTQLLPANTKTPLTSIPAGSVVSVDTVIDGGKLFAISVRTGPPNAAELNGQILRYDAAKSRVILRDPMSPKSVALRITPSTVVVNRGQPASPQALSAGMLVQVWFSPAQNAANRIEILAERGNSFTFQGRIVAVDLRSRVVALSNDSDQSVHEVTIGSLDSTSIDLLREGADVSIQAEFDGERYNARTVNLVSRNP